MRARPRRPRQAIITDRSAGLPGNRECHRFDSSLPPRSSHWLPGGLPV